MVIPFSLLVSGAQQDEEELHLIDDTREHRFKSEAMPRRVDDDDNFSTMTLPCAGDTTDINVPDDASESIESTVSNGEADGFTLRGLVDILKHTLQAAAQDAQEGLSQVICRW